MMQDRKQNALKLYLNIWTDTDGIEDFLVKYIY